MILTDFVRNLRRDGEKLYAVMDGCHDDYDMQRARNRFRIERRSLFDGPADRELNPMAPYLIAIPWDSPFLECWAERKTRSSGILLISSLETDDLRTHLWRSVIEWEEERGAVCSCGSTIPSSPRLSCPG